MTHRYVIHTIRAYLFQNLERLVVINNAGKHWY